MPNNISKDVLDIIEFMKGKTDEDSIVMIIFLYLQKELEFKKKEDIRYWKEYFDNIRKLLSNK